MYDLTRFLVILMLFVAGFTLHVTSIFQVLLFLFFRFVIFQFSQPISQLMKTVLSWWGISCKRPFYYKLRLMLNFRLASPGQTLEMLFFSLFGLVEPDSMFLLFVSKNIYTLKATSTSCSWFCQNCIESNFRHIHDGNIDRFDQLTNCNDVRYVPAHSGTIRQRMEIWTSNSYPPNE